MAAKGKSEQPAETEAVTAEVEAIIEADVKTLRPAQRAVLELLSGLENLATEDTDARPFGEDIAAILMAEDEAIMWEADELPRINAKVLSGCEMELFGWDAKFSDDPEIVTDLIGPTTRRKMFLLVRAVRLNNSGQTNLYRLPKVGEEFVWNTSARFIVAKLYWLQMRGHFDNGRAVKCRIEGTDLGGGKKVEKLKLLDPGTLSGTAEPPPF